MNISLVMATANRSVEIKRFCDSLVGQSYSLDKINLIIVDQNTDNRLETIVDEFKTTLKIHHIKSNKKGLSLARNLGLKALPKNQDIVAFPDDDCWYPPHLIRDVVDAFRKYPQYDGLTGRSVDQNGLESSGRFSKRNGLIDKYNVWGRAISYTVFVKCNLVRSIGGFDEKLGVGSGTIYNSGEETDYIIQAISKGFKIYYDKNIKVCHPNKILHYSDKVINRAFGYGCGCGKVLQKHGYPIWYKLRFLYRPFGGTIFSFFSLRVSKAQYHWNVYRGRLKGMT